jgi:hypothetical protein
VSRSFTTAGAPGTYVRTRCEPGTSDHIATGRGCSSVIALAEDAPAVPCHTTIEKPLDATLPLQLPVVGNVGAGVVGAVLVGAVRSRLDGSCTSANIVMIDPCDGADRAVRLSGGRGDHHSLPQYAVPASTA